MTFPVLRPRTSAHRDHTGALSRIVAGAFGVGSPIVNSSAQVDPRSKASSLYAYHEGDLFTPGTGNYVFETLLELPLKTLYGGGSGINQGTPYPINAWPVGYVPPIVSMPTVTTFGYGGLQAGAFVQQPLLDQWSNNG